MPDIRRPRRKNNLIGDMVRKYRTGLLVCQIGRCGLIGFLPLASGI